MKIVIICLAFIPLTLSAQKTLSDKLESNAEKFSDRSGSLIQKEFISVGEIAKCKVEIVYYSDLIDNKRASAVRFQYEARESYGSDTKIATLDNDELDGLISSLKIIRDKILPSSPANYVEVTFKSRGGFEGGCYKDKKGWSLYLKLEKYDGKSFVFFEKTDLEKLILLLIEAKSKL